MIDAVVLCAGLGTRLRPLTELWPKPALPLLGEPLLRHAFTALSRAGLTAVGINTHHLPERMKQVAQAEAARAGLGLTVLHEPLIQGTGGGIRGFRDQAKGPLVVWNGDILFALDLKEVLAEHARGGADATLVLMPMPAAERYAAVDVDAHGRVVRIAGKGPGGPSTPWHFTGVHVLSDAVFDFMGTGPLDINRDVYPRMMEEGRRIQGHRVSAYWSDLGTPSRYLATQRDVLFGQVPGLSPPSVQRGRCEGKVAGPAFFDEGSVIEKDAWIGSAVYVGRGARVGAGARLNRVAVMEGTVVAPGEELVEVIAFGEHRIPAQFT